MGLLSPRRIEETLQALRTRAGRLFQTISLTLTPDEFIDGFIQPEHIEPLNKVRELVGVVGNWYATTKLRSGDVHMAANIMFHGGPPIIIPNYVASGPRVGLSPDVANKLQAWADDRVRYGELFGDAYDGLRWLNEEAKDLRAMRAMFPALPILLKDISAEDKSPTSKMALRLDSNKTVVTLPRLPREVAARLLEASQLISSTTLFESATLEEKQLPQHATFARDTNNIVKRWNIFYPGMGLNGTFI